MATTSRVIRHALTASLATLVLLGPLIGVATASAVQAQTGQVVGSKTAPAVEDCGLSAPKLKPASLTIACADANTLVDAIHWSSWTSTSATGTGTFTWNTCVPNCAASKTWDKASSTVKLERPVRTSLGWLFEELVVHVTGKVPEGVLTSYELNESPLAVAPSPSVTVTPSTGLRNEQKISVSGKSFPKKTALVIVECSSGVLKGQSAACDAAHLVSVTTGADGTFTKTSFEVLTGTIGNGKCGTTTKNLTCYIFVSEPTTKTTAESDATITFARP